MSGTTAHATTALRTGAGSIFAPATASCGRNATVVQQSLALPCGAHASSPSLQHAIALDVETASGAHAAHTDQLKAVATVKARRRAPRNVIVTIVPHDCIRIGVRNERTKALLEIRRFRRKTPRRLARWNLLPQER